MIKMTKITEVTKTSDARFRSHGANPEKLYTAFGIELPERIMDFSSNTNPLRGIELDIDMQRAVSAYPDDESSKLRGLIAEKNRIPEECVLVTNGSNEAIYLIASMMRGRSACILQPCYGEYRRALDAHGAETRGIFSVNDINMGAACAFICNPCNPTGGYIPPGALYPIFEKHPRTLFVIDEAYIDFMRGDAEYLGHAPNLVILRSLTKIYHLCGVRAGYVMGSRENIAALKRLQPTWSVNAIAQDAALQYMNSSFAERTQAFMDEEAPRLEGMIRSAGFDVRPSRTNFFLVETDDDEGLIKYLLRRGIVVRHTRNFPGIDGSCVRIAVRLREENDALVRAMRDFKCAYTS